MSAPSGFTAVSGSHFTDATGSAIAYVICFRPATSTGVCRSFRSGGSSPGQVSEQPVSLSVPAGEGFSLNLADVSLTLPPYVGYIVTAQDPNTGKSLLSQGYFIQPTGPSFNFDAYVAGTASTPTGTSGSGSGGGLPFASPVAGVTFIDSVDSSHWNLTYVGGVQVLSQGSDIGTPVAGITFIDIVDSSHWNLTVASGVLAQWAGSDIGTPISSVSIIDSDTSNHVISVASGVRVVT